MITAPPSLPQTQTKNVEWIWLLAFIDAGSKQILVWKRQIYSTLTKVYMVMRWSDIHPNGDKLLVGVGK